MLRPSILATALLGAAAIAQNPPVPPPPQVAPPPSVPAGAPQPRATIPTPPAPAAIPGPPVTPPPVVPAVPGGTTLNPNPAALSGEGTIERNRIEFNNAEAKEIITALEKYTGNRYIMNNQPMGSITVSITPGREGMPHSEIAKLIEMHLLINGIVLSPTETPNVWKVSGAALPPKSVGIPFIDREELLPANEQVVSYLFKLNFADPTELAQVVQGQILVAGPGAYMSVVAMPAAQAILVTESTPIIRMLIRIVKNIDVQPAQVESKFITLEHSKAEDVVASLEKLFEQPSTAQGQQPGQPQRQPRNPNIVTGPDGNPLPGQGNGATAAAAGGVEFNGGDVPSEQRIVAGKVKITADKRTNRVHIVARPTSMKFIEALVKEYDIEVPLEKPAMRPVRYRPVEEVMEAIVTSIKDPGEREGGATGTAGATPGQGQRPQTNNFNNNSGNNRFGGGDTFGGSGGGVSSIGESLSTSERDPTPLVQQLKNATIIGDRLSNSIVVIGTPDIKQKVFALLDELDRRPAHVMIYTVIGELKLTEKEEFGMEYILRNGGILPTTTPTTPGTGTTAPSTVGFNDGGQGILNLNGILNQQNITRALTAGSGGFNGILMAGNSFDAVVKALENTGRFRVVTRPSIFTMNNKRASITSGEEVPVPTSTLTSFNNGGTNGQPTSSSQIQFKPIQLKLEVLPLINSDKEVSLEIVQNISERAGSTRIDNNDIPNVAQRAIKTTVSMPNNATLILGGLIKESMDRNQGGITGLNRLPLIGPLFGKRSKDGTRTELIVMMRPVVTLAPPENDQLRERYFEALNIPPDLESSVYKPNARETIPKPKVLKPAPAQPTATKRPASNGVRR